MIHLNPPNKIRAERMESDYNDENKILAVHIVHKSLTFVLAVVVDKRKYVIVLHFTGSN